MSSENLGLSETPAHEAAKPSHAEVEEAMRFLQYARSDLREVVMKARIQGLYQRLLRPFSLSLAFLGVGGLTLLLYSVLRSGSASFSLALLLYLGPILAWTYRVKRTDGLDLAPFLADIHRSDQAMMDYGERSLLAWPSLHPEEALASPQPPTLDALHSAVTARLEQLRRICNPPRP